MEKAASFTWVEKKSLEKAEAMGGGWKKAG